MGEQLVERRTGRSLDLGWCRITRTGLDVTGVPTMEQWQGLGEILATLEGGIAWLVGDWLNSGEKAFGEMASQAIDAEQWKPETVRVYRWVCEKVPKENRTMSFAHCQIVAGLAPIEQREWLAKAAGDGTGAAWSSGRLKNEIAAASSTDAPKIEYLCTVSFDQPAARDILAEEYERVGRPVFRTERTRKRKDV